MLDQQRLKFLSTIDDLADDNVDVAAVLARVRLLRLTPTTVEQRAGRRHPGGRRGGLLRSPKAI